jgi:hypothetical protein
LTNLADHLKKESNDLQGLTKASAKNALLTSLAAHLKTGRIGLQRKKGHLKEAKNLLEPGKAMAKKTSRTHSGNPNGNGTRQCQKK